MNKTSMHLCYTYIFAAPVSVAMRLLLCIALRDHSNVRESSVPKIKPWDYLRPNAFSRTLTQNLTTSIIDHH